MEQETLRLLIRGKLAYGLLPHNSIHRIWGGPSHGETCDACDLLVEKREFVMEGISLTDANLAGRPHERRRSLQLHVECFWLWDFERRGDQAGPALPSGH